jgi:hypothetical protein
VHGVRAPTETGRQLLSVYRVRLSLEARIPWGPGGGRRCGARLCVSDRLRSCFESTAAGGNVGRGHPQAASSVGCRFRVERASSGVGGPSQGGRWASALRSGSRWQWWPSGRRRRLRFRVGGELASDTRGWPRGGGNISEQPDGVSSERASKRRSEYAVGWVCPNCSALGRGRADWIRCTVSGRASRHDASGVAPSPVLHASS